MRWQLIARFPLYEISEAGEVRKVGTMRPLKSFPVKGYLAVSLYGESGYFQGVIHRIASQTFLGPRPEGMQVNHKNGNALDNRAENLEYVSPQQNIWHRDNVLKTTARGERSGKAVLTTKKVIRIRKLSAQGLTHRKIAALLGVGKTTVANVVHLRTWHHV